MSQNATITSLVRLSVTSGSRRADLGLPGSVPVAEIIPDLARELGVLNAQSASLGYRLVRTDGTPVDADRSLAAQGIEDGAALSLQANQPDGEKVYDDVVEAVADLVETQYTPWTAANSAITAMAASVVLFLCAAFALFTARDNGALIAAVAGVGALLIIGASAVLSRVRAQPIAACALAMTAVVYAWVAGSAVAPSDSLWGPGLFYPGLGVVVAGSLGAVAISRYRNVVASTTAVGVAMMLVGGLNGSMGWDLTVIATCIFVVASIAGNVLPWVGVSTSRLSTHPPKTDAEVFADAPEVESDTMSRRVRAGHEFMVAVGLASSMVMVLCTPQLIASGVAGALLALVGYAATLLRTRHCRTRTTVLLAMIGGVSGLAVAGVSGALTHPDWRPVLAVGLAVSAAIVVALALVLPKARLRMGRLADGVETVSLVALFPLAAFAVGVL